MAAAVRIAGGMTTALAMALCLAVLTASSAEAAGYGQVLTSGHGFYVTVGPPDAETQSFVWTFNWDPNVVKPKERTTVEKQCFDPSASGLSAWAKMVGFSDYGPRSSESWCGSYPDSYVHGFRVWAHDGQNPGDDPAAFIAYEWTAEGAPQPACSIAAAQGGYDGSQLTVYVRYNAEAEQPAYWVADWTDAAGAAATKRVSSAVPGSPGWYGFQLHPTSLSGDTVTVTDPAIDGCVVSLVVGSDPQAGPVAEDGSAEGCGFIGIGCVIDWLLNVPEMVMGWFVPSTETQDRWDGVTTTAEGRFPFSLVAGPVSWVGQLGECPTGCAVGDGLHFKVPGTDAVLLTGGPEYDGYREGLRTLAGFIVYGLPLVGLAIWAFQRFAPGGD